MERSRKVFMHVNFTPDDLSIGITKKINGQIKALRNMGFVVYYTGYLAEGIGVFNNEDQCVFYKKYPPYGKGFIRRIRFFLLIRVAISFLESNDFDVGYSRFAGFGRLYLRMIKLMKKKNMKVIVESLAYFPGAKYDGLTGKYIMIVTKLNKPKAGKYIDLIASEGAFESLWGIPAVQFDNGVVIDDFRLHKYIGNKDKLVFIAVGNETIYHGIDRLLKSMKEYKEGGGTVEIQLHLVGVMSDKTLKMVKSLSLDSCVFFHGKQFGNALEDIYDQCNIGVGPLAQHRIGGKKVTGLKTKEYFAKGMPYIYSGEEPSAPEGYPYIHRVPDDESTIDFKGIISFYNLIKDDEDMAANMRMFAKDHFSWDRIMRKIVAFSFEE